MEGGIVKKWKLLQVVGFLLCAAGAVAIGGGVAPEWAPLMIAGGVLVWLAGRAGAWWSRD